MFCPYCGKQLPDDAKFCSKCGTALSPVAPGNGAQRPQFVRDPSLPEGIFRDDKGAFHWIYEMDMLRNPVPLFTLMKISFFIYLGLALLICGIELYNGVEAGRIAKDFAIVVLGIGGFFQVLVIVSWLILMAMKKSCYVFEFMMTEKKIVTLETQEDRKKMPKLAVFTFALGMLERNATLAGAGMAAAAGSVFTSEYTDVKAVIAKPRQDLIKVNNVLQRNTIYALPHQYEFVWNYITAHCQSAKIKK